MDEEKQYICKHCGLIFTDRYKLTGHSTYCKLNPNYEYNKLKAIENIHNKHINKNTIIYKGVKCECQYCHNLYFKYGIKNHEKSCKKNPNYIIIHNNINNSHPAWNKGLTKNTDKRLKKAGETYSLHYKEGLFKTTGGYREGSIKNYKCGDYHGIHCDSSWELAYIVYCENNNISILRNKEYLIYIDNDNKKHKFYPDFLINNNLLVEIKGRQDPNYKYKSELNKNVKFLYKEDMKSILDYVINLYGKDFVNILYE